MPSLWRHKPRTQLNPQQTPGLTKRSLDVEGATGLRDQAANAFPVLKRVDPVLFGKLLSGGEILLGAALIAPVVPTWAAAAGLAGFSGALMRVYLKTPGMTREDGIRPAPAGMGIARDVFMLGSALGLLVEELTSRQARRKISGKTVR